MKLPKLLPYTLGGVVILGGVALFLVLNQPTTEAPNPTPNVPTVEEIEEQEYLRNTFLMSNCTTRRNPDNVVMSCDFQVLEAATNLRLIPEVVTIGWTDPATPEQHPQHSGSQQLKPKFVSISLDAFDPGVQYELVGPSIGIPVQQGSNIMTITYSVEKNIMVDTVTSPNVIIYRCTSDISCLNEHQPEEFRIITLTPEVLRIEWDQTYLASGFTSTGVLHTCAAEKIYGCEFYFLPIIYGHSDGQQTYLDSPYKNTWYIGKNLTFKNLFNHRDQEATIFGAFIYNSSLDQYFLDIMEIN